MPSPPGVLPTFSTPTGANRGVQLKHLPLVSPIFNPSNASASTSRRQDLNMSRMESVGSFINPEFALYPGEPSSSSGPESENSSSSESDLDSDEMEIRTRYLSIQLCK